ncbi:ABC transporter substrate-binding protein [Methanothrix sp.]|jgi:iron complex transport system substrate-binding protein|uniref:ABC transporter substrate-binding protein n=1 Tax=Methanothrix sp. TaxID=90426 RepID=UPI0032AF3D15
MDLKELKQMTGRVLGILLIALIFLGFPGACEDATEGLNEKIVTILDDDGQSVNVTMPVETIVSMGSYNSELIYALGGGDRIIGRCSYSNYPAPLMDVAVVAKSSHKPDLEAIVKIKPDLVVADGMLSSDNRKEMEDAGIPVLVYSSLDPKTVVTVVEDLGILLEKEDRANEIISFINQYQSMIDEHVAGLEETDKPLVFFEWSKPYYSMGKGTNFDNLSVAVGGINVVADQKVKYPTVDPEWLVEIDPDVIVRSVSAQTDENLTEIMVRTRNEILSRPELADVTAIKDGRVHTMASFVTYGIGSIIGELYLAKWFHPDLFEDIDPEAVHQELLEKFFGGGPQEMWVYP